MPKADYSAFPKEVLIMRNEKNRRPDTVTEEAELERVSGGM